MLRTALLKMLLQPCSSLQGVVQGQGVDLALSVFQSVDHRGRGADIFENAIRMDAFKQVDVPQEFLLLRGWEMNIVASNDMLHSKTRLQYFTPLHHSLAEIALS